MKYVSWIFFLAIGMFWQSQTFAQTVALGEVSTLRAQSTTAQAYEWTFPGGIVINGEVVQFTFTQAGSQEVKLKVTALDGSTNEIIKRILVANTGRPTAVIEARVGSVIQNDSLIEAKIGDAIRLDSKSFAVGKTADDFTDTWTVNNRTYTQESVSNAFDKIGTYTIRLTVKDPLNNNQQDQAILQLKIVNQAPVINSVKLKTLGDSNEQVQVTIDADDADGTLSTFKFEALEAGQSLMTQVVQNNSTVFDLSRFAGKHEYNFRVTVSDDRFLSTTVTDSQTVVVDPVSTNAAPEIKLNAVPGNQGITNESFDFKADATDADGDVMRYEWTFSDGRRFNNSEFQAKFSEAGTYTVTLEVSDGLATSTKSLDITITEPAVVAVVNQAPEIDLYGVLPAKTAPMNSMFRFYLKAVDADKDNLDFEWDFGNGSKSFTQNAAIVYNLPGDYTVKVAVSDGTVVVRDEVKVTVEMGANDLYFETSEDRLVDLQSQQQRILDDISANGGAITPAQQSQLQALNNDISALIGEARSAGDFGAITKLEQISNSLNLQLNQIEAVAYDGMTITELGVKLKEDQALEIEEIEAQTEILEEITSGINQTVATDLQTVIDAAAIKNEALKTLVSEERVTLKTEKDTLKSSLKTAKESGDTTNAVRLASRLEAVNLQIEASNEKTIALQTQIIAKQSDLRNEKSTLLAQLKTARAAEDQANVTSLQGRIDVVNAEMTAAEDKTASVRADILDARAGLVLEKEALTQTLKEARLTGDTANAAQAQARLVTVNEEITAASAATLALQESVIASRASLETEKASLLAELAMAKASEDATNIARVEARLTEVNTGIEEASAQTLAINQTVSEARAALETEKIELLETLEVARAAGDTANAAKAQARLETVNEAITAATTTTMALQESVTASRESLQAEKEALLAALVLARSEGDTANTKRLEARLKEVHSQIETATLSTQLLNKEIEVSRVALEIEKADLLIQIDAALKSGNKVDLARAQARLEVVNLEIEAANRAALKTQKNIESERLKLIEQKEFLFTQYTKAKASGDLESLERVRAQLVETERMLAALSSKSSEEYYAEQRATYEARKTSLDLVISEFEKAKQSGKSIEEFTATLQAQANAANPSSDEFKLASVALEQQERIERSSFLAEQLVRLEEARKNPTTLPRLGVSRQSNETLGERLNRVESEAEKASIEAAERQASAAKIAGAKQLEQLNQLKRLQAEFDSEQDATRKTIIAARMGVVEKEIAALERIKNPGEALTTAEVEKRVENLQTELETTNDIVITEQQAFIATRLAELQVEIDLAADPRIKAALESEKRRLQSNLSETGLLTDYEAQLKASQKALNERLATNLNTTAELLVQTQLNSVEGKLLNLENLSSTQAKIKVLEKTDISDPDVQAAQFLQTEKEALELELREIKVKMSRTSDVVETKALEQREQEIIAQLKAFPERSTEAVTIDNLLVVKAVDYLKHYREVESQTLSIGVEDKKPAKLALIDSQIKLLKELNNFGYTPQTTLATMLIDLERRENQLLALFRDSTGTEADALKKRLLVIAEAVDQLEGLADYQIPKTETVYRATQKLEAAIDITAKAFIEADTETEKIVATQTLNEMRISQRWLNRFYNDDKRDTTIGELEQTLRTAIAADSDPKTIADLVAFQSLKINLNAAIAAQVKTDFDNFKLNLQKQVKQMNDEDEKIKIENRIKSLNYENFADQVTLAKAEMFQSLLADLTIKANSNLFLYADIPLTQYEEPLLFEWNLGDGEKRFGQNVGHEYFEPGFYRVVLTMFDGVTSEQDLFTIKVIE